jgi:hypothetical protein
VEAPYKFVNRCPSLRIELKQIPAVLEYDENNPEKGVMYYGWDEPCKGEKQI